MALASESNSRNKGDRQYVAYYRVSSPGQHRSGLGLESQRADVLRYVAGAQGKLVAELTEAKSGWKGVRPQLAEALRICRMRRAVLVIATLDRLARNFAFITELMDSSIEFVVADFPIAERFTLYILAAVAEYEAHQDSQRIKSVMATARARGVKLGAKRGSKDMRAAVAGAVAARRARAAALDRDLAPTIWELRARGMSTSAIATHLDQEGILAPRGGEWRQDFVAAVLRRTAGRFPDQAMATEALPDWRDARAQQRAEKLASLVWPLRLAGRSLTSIAEELTRLKVATVRGGRWQSSGIFRILRRTAITHAAHDAKAAEVCLCRRSEHARRRMLDLAPTLWTLRNEGKSLSAIARDVTQRGIRAPAGVRWSASTIRSFLMATAHIHAPNDPLVTAVRLGRHPDEKKARAMLYAPAMWELRASGESIKGVAREMNRRNILPPSQRRWHGSTVRTVLRLTADEFQSFSEAAKACAPCRVIRSKKRALERAPAIWSLRAAGKTQAEIAKEMTLRGVATSGGKGIWDQGAVAKILAMTASEFPEFAAAAKMAPGARLARARERYMKLAPLIWRLRAQAHSIPEIADELKRRKIPTPSGGCSWLSGVAALLKLTASSFPKQAKKAKANLRRVRADQRASKIGPLVWRLRKNGATRAAIADELNRRRIERPSRRPWNWNAVDHLIYVTTSAFGRRKEAA